MATQVCTDCTTRYAYGLAGCPHCRGTQWVPSWQVNEGGEQPFPGSSSSTSSENTKPTSEPPLVSDRQRARTAASPSKPTGASNTAPPVTGDQTASDNEPTT